MLTRHIPAGKQENWPFECYIPINPACPSLRDTWFPYLGALAARPTWDAGLPAIDLVDGQEGVGRTLLALAGLLLNVVSRRAGHTG